ncbi:hypothetical protein BASA83_007599 [Batrachochytrium salamandrivorans]|nr:hypothetical protein BASA83_007599 [Batrachochytrium salamandrivorans]
MITDSETSNRHYSVGERIQVQGESATIRYIGPVEGKVGTWLGVEWDDPSRGKHGGTFNGQTYFTTLAALRADPSGCSVTAGSFLSASKAGITIGQSVLAALSQKYHSEQPIDGTVAFGGDTAITVETVGWDKIKGKQSHLENVTTLGLAGLCISFCGTDPAELDSVRRSCVSVTDLDLSRNLLSRWTDVANIVDLMPMLKLLRLSVNRFVSADETLPPTKSVLNPHDSAKTCDVDLAQSFSGISQMALMSTMMSWADVEHIEPWFANLQELYLGSNHIKSLVGTSSLPLPDFVTGFVHLTVLSLENNSISHWSQVQRLGKLPNLKNLNLAGNQLKSIEIDKEDPIEPMFAQLTTLSLHHNLIDTWTSIHALNSLPKLAEVRLTLNPITSLDLSGRPSSTERTSAAQGTDAPSLSSSMFWILVGRLARVTQLNGSQITQRDRLNGEMYYPL